MEDWQDDLVPEKDSTEPTVATEKPLKQNFKKKQESKNKRQVYERMPLKSSVTKLEGNMAGQNRL